MISIDFFLGVVVPEELEHMEGLALEPACVLLLEEAAAQNQLRLAGRLALVLFVSDDVPD